MPPSTVSTSSPGEAGLAAFLATRAEEILAARQFDRLYLSAFVTVGAAYPAAAVEFAVSPDQLPIIFTGPTVTAALEKYDAAHGPEALRARARRLRAAAAALEAKLS
jgi:hypothetical protein